MSTLTPTGAAEYFGERVAHYDSRYEALDADGHALRARMSAVIGLVGSGPGDLLDVGMGAGRLCDELARRGWRVSGADASPEMVEAARHRLPDVASRFVCAPIQSLPFAADSFDVVTATGVLEYVDIEAALMELRRVLRPGGRAVVSYPNPRAAYGIWKTRLWYPLVRLGKRLLRRPHPRMPHGAGELTSRQFVALLEQAGLERRACVRTSFLPVVTPIELAFPRLTARLGQRLEGREGRLATAFATQVVYEAAKPQTGEGSQ